MSSRTTNYNLIKPDITEKALIGDINNNMDTIDTALAAKANSTELSSVEDGLAILANGNTHAAIASGQAVFVRNHSSLANGLYWAKAAIAQNAALSTSNLTADSAGGLNALKADVDTLSSNINNIGSFNTIINENVSIGSSYVSTGKTFTLTKASIVSVSQSYSDALPLAIGVKGSTSNVSPSFIYAENAGKDDNVAGLWAHGVLGAGTYYVWAKVNGSGGSNAIRVDVYQIKA